MLQKAFGHPVEYHNEFSPFSEFEILDKYSSSFQNLRGCPETVNKSSKNHSFLDFNDNQAQQVSESGIQQSSGQLYHLVPNVKIYPANNLDILQFTTESIFPAIVSESTQEPFDFINPHRMLQYTQAQLDTFFNWYLNNATSWQCNTHQYYDHQNNACKNCDAKCATCFYGGNKFCIQCVSTKFYHTNYECVNQCKDIDSTKSYVIGNIDFNGTTMQGCIDCHSSCATCSDGTSNGCLTCPSTSYKQGGQCLTECNSGYYPDGNNVCQQCDPKCSACYGSLDTQCNVCSGGNYYMYNNKCVSTCSSVGFYISTVTVNSASQNVCIPCHSDCYTCTGSTYDTCTQCTDSSKVLQNGKCQIACDDGFYPNSNKVCQACDSKCDTCYGPSNTQCTKCSSGKYYFQSDTCVTQCTDVISQGYYTDYIVSNGYSQLTCLPCHSDCLTCINGTANGCTTCSDLSKVLQGNTCQVACDNGYSADTNKICQQCDPKCSECYGLTSYQCTLCQTGYLYYQNNSCMTQCSDISSSGFYIDQLTVNGISRQSCMPCHSDCQQCFDSTSTGCTLCSDPNKVLQGNTCQPTCDNGFYSDSNKVCQPCDPKCLDCFGPSSTQCTVCLGTAFYYSPDTCVSQCSDISTSGLYIDTVTINGVPHQSCMHCHSDCSQCLDSSISSCLQCSDPSKVLQGGLCQTTCDNGYYADSNSVCQPCDSKCAECFGPSNTECTICESNNFYYFPDTCVTQCTDIGTTGLYIDTLSINGVQQQTCLHCHTDCAQCINSQDTGCTECSDPTKVLLGNQCLTGCGNGYYPDVNNVCQPCHPYCAQCTAASNSKCNQCNTGYFLQVDSTTCLSTCPPGTTPSATTNECEQCYYTCETCSGTNSDQCETCKSPFFFRQNSCLLTCPTGEFAINNICQGCDYKCASCFGPNDNQCTQCKDNYFFMNQTCYETCPDGYYGNINDKTCQQCPLTCKKCSAENICTECITKDYQLTDGKCNYVECLPGQYKSYSPRLDCYDCHSSCLTCTGATEYDCLACKPWMYLKNNKCISCGTIPGMRLITPSSGNPFCTEVCGDGINLGYHECDDGNLFDGDGCNSECQVEPGFKCSGGSNTTKDTCFDIRRPIPSIASINQEIKIKIALDNEVSSTKILDNSTIQLTIQGSLEMYNYIWIVEPRQTRTFLAFYITLTPLQSLTGSEYVEIQWLDKTLFIDKNKNIFEPKILTASLPIYEFIDAKTEAQVTKAAESSVQTTFGGLALNLGFSILFGGSLSQMWTLLNTIQLMSLLPLMAVQWPKTVRIFFQQMIQSHGETKIIPNLLYEVLFIDKKYRTEEPLNNRFYSYGWTSSSFINLAGRKIMIWSLLAISYPFVLLMKRKLYKRHRYCRFWKGLEQKYRYNIVLRGLIVSYVSIFLAGLLNIASMDLASDSNIFSLSLACIFLAILVYLPILIMNIFQNNYNKIKSKRFLAMYSTVINELDLSDQYKYMYYSIFLIRRMAFVLTLVVFANWPIVQLCFNHGLCVVMLMYYIIIKPQHLRALRFLNVLSEVIMLSLHMLSIPLLNCNQVFRDQLGWVILAFIVTYIGINWVVIVYVMIQEARDKCKRQKQTALEDNQTQINHWNYRHWKKLLNEERQHQRKQLKDIVNKIIKDNNQSEKQQDDCCIMSFDSTYSGKMQGPQTTNDMMNVTRGQFCLNDDISFQEVENNGNPHFETISIHRK